MQLNIKKKKKANNPDKNGQRILIDIFLKKTKRRQKDGQQAH